MIKVISVFKRKEGMSVEAFQDYWRTVHAPLVQQLSGVQRYVQNHTLLGGYRRGEPAVDGVAELWFEDSDVLRRLSATDELKAVTDDHLRFMDMSSYKEIVTEDVVIKDGRVPSAGVKNIELVHRKQGMEPTAFHQYWIEHHGPLGASIPQIHRYVQSHTRASAYSDDKEPALDGVALTWFENTQSMREAATTPQYAETRADEVNFVTEPLDFVITTEHVITAN
ncbi:MAG: EthD domain-containing protein [Gammaproteobacteria bacterium]